MVTFADLTTRVRQYLYGFSQQQQQWSYLTAPIASSDVTLFVNDATQVSRGVIEVDGNELMLVKNVSRTANTVTIDPFARGWAGSTAASHSTNARIENNPIWPTIRVKEAINDAIRSVYPDLFAVSTTKVIKVSVQYQYPMPSDSEEIVSIKYQIIGPSKQYPYPKKWRFDGQADPTDFPTGKAVWIGEEVTPGREIFITYRKEPTELVNDSDDFTTVTGLPSTAWDVIVYGACMKLAPQLESPRLILDSVEASERATSVQPGSASKVSAYYGQLFDRRLQQEARKMSDRFQSPAHFDQ